MVATTPGASTHHIPSTAFAGLDDDQLEALYRDLDAGRGAIAVLEPLGAAALYDRPLRLVYAEIVARAFAQAHPMTETELRAMWGDR